MISMGNYIVNKNIWGNNDEICWETISKTDTKLGHSSVSFHIIH